MDRNDRAAGSSAGEEAHVSHPELLRYGVLVRPTPIDRGREPCLTRQPRESHQGWPFLVTVAYELKSLVRSPPSAQPGQQRRSNA